MHERLERAMGEARRKKLLREQGILPAPQSRENDEECLKTADWRSYQVITLAQPFVWPGSNETLPAGAIAKVSGFLDYGQDRMAVTLPSATALFLNLSRTHYKLASQAADRFPSGQDPVSPDDENLFGYTESIMASVVFAYTALESFANEEIPDDFTFTIKQKKCNELYSKEQIERSLSLRTKLGEVLPEVHKIVSPKGVRVWHDFLELEQLRNDIIHMKTADREHVGHSNQSIWSKLLKLPIPDVVPTAKAIIDYYYRDRELKPHWYEHYPLGSQV